MSLADIVRSGVALADGITASLQAPVSHYVYSEATVDDSGKVTWALPRVRMGVVEHNRVQMRDKEGREVISETTLTFPRAFDVGPLDKFVLPDGTGNCPAKRVGGIVDPKTNKAYMFQVWI